MPRLRHTTAALMPGFATLGDVVDDIVNEARASNKYFWWELPGLAQFAPANIGTLFGMASGDPVGYLKMLDDVNRHGNRGGEYFMGRVAIGGQVLSWPAGPIDSFERFVSGSTDAQKQSAWRWLWGLSPYARQTAATNVGVAYVNMRAEEAAARARAQAEAEKASAAEAAARAEQARRAAAAESGETALAYQGQAGAQAIKVATSEAKTTVDVYEAPAKALGIKNPFEFLTKLSLGIKIAAGVATVVVGTVLIRSFTRR